ncbi:CHAD domain-containing protein [Sphingomonas jatrophae]|uniref:Inorganic triphosphatase YgiF, contains CYTH and CHAD domains n=1 Tax=Sphingomonas jatrophae TaxID=1166337 RepID=A0A1I6JCM6_9SPHN|nr:CHAD domain-containing protein [Sphingomonas jatrophae]SFR76719.1 Inorganic triphosphatase YgiF, contains CYTH and CHAD domains [Sphingomonas jatrophae]
MDEPREIELKLDIAEADLAAARDLFGGGADVVRQCSTYYDTPDGALAAEGVSLRVREAKGRFVQTVKTEGGRAAGLFARPEWECALDTADVRVGADTPLPALLGAAVGSIAPRFTVENERQTWQAEVSGSVVEVVLDRATIMAGQCRQTFAEIELELKQGSVDALFRIARRIEAVAPVRIGVLSKADRGARLRAGPPGGVKAEPVMVNKDGTALAAFRRVAQACMRHYRLNEMVLIERRDAHALHQARVALRRLRSAFTVWKRLLPAEAAEAHAADLRWLAAVLGNARNLDVLIERVPTGALRERIAAAREASYDEVQAVLASGRIRAVMLDLAEWLAVGLDGVEEGPPTAEFAAEALSRWRRRVKRDGRNLAKADDETRHELRKDAKKLRYTAEFFASLFAEGKVAKRRKRFLERLEVLQDELGALNDLATAPEVFADLGLTQTELADALPDDARKPRHIARAAAAMDDLIDTRPFWR